MPSRGTGSYRPPTLPENIITTNANAATNANATSDSHDPMTKKQPEAPAPGPPSLNPSGSGGSPYMSVSRDSESDSASDADTVPPSAVADEAAEAAAAANAAAAAGGSGSGEDDSGMSLTELLYGTSSYHAIAKPVGLTMILAALATVYINDEETLAAGEEQLAAAYTVFSVGGENQSAASSASLSLLNALIICAGIGLMTFGIVLLYKYRCMKCLIGYMIFSSTMLLGFLGGVVFDVAVEIYRLPIDQFSFYFTLWNFAVVGTTSIFYQKGIPTKVTQGYLVATSVILAWQLSHFSDWMAWSLLVMLALYDLCAVLTPCGPLKMLVNEFQADDAPEMPGLLYEESLPSEARRPGRGGGGGGRSRSQRASSSGNSGGERIGGRLRHSGAGYAMAERSGPSAVRNRRRGNTGNIANGNDNSETTVINEETPVVGSASVEMSSSTLSEGPPTGFLPLAIAKIYRLPYANPAAVPGAGSAGGLLEGDEQGASPNALLSREFTPTELQTDVEVIFPRNGGRITREDGADGRARYIVKDRHGVIKRTLLVNNQGKVFEEVEGDDDDASEDGGRNSIKLGLGDFIFYSVLVSKAAQYSFSTFIACFLVILAGLGGTLVLLSVYHQALPALPISIFLGVLFYVITRLVVEPWIQDMLRAPFFV